LYVLPRTPAKTLARGQAAAATPEMAGPEIERKVVKAPSGARRAPLVGFVVSKKVCKNASDRNRAKRRVREAYRLIRTKLHEMSEQTSIDSKKSLYDVKESLEEWYALVWVLNESSLNAPWQDICTTITACLEEAAQKFGGRRGKAGSSQTGR
jgi:ribonuclease P protein component